METLGDQLTDEDLEAACDEFRQDRDLLSGEEMEAWLERWALSVDDWVDYVKRRLAYERSQPGFDDFDPPADAHGAFVPQNGAVAAADIEHPTPNDEAEAAVWAEAVCSGAIVRWAERLAERLAVWHATAGADCKASGCAPPSLDVLETAFRRFAVALVTDHALANQVRQHQISWIRAKCTRFWFRTQAEAEEAALQLREDGQTLEAVVQASGTPFERRTWFLDELEAPTADRILSAEPGACLGPLPDREGFAVVLIHDKVLPTLDDVVVRRRAEHALVARAVNDLVQDQVTWSWRG